METVLCGTLCTNSNCQCVHTNFIIAINIFNIFSYFTKLINNICEQCLIENNFKKTLLALADLKL